MPKMKTRKTVAARFKLTGSGQLLRRHPNRRHKLSKKTSLKKRNLAHPALVDVSQLKLYKRLMCV